MEPQGSRLKAGSSAHFLLSLGLLIMGSCYGHLLMRAEEVTAPPMLISRPTNFDHQPRPAEVEAKLRKFLLLLSGPLLMLPIGILTCLLSGSYESEEIGHLQKIPLFLQGSTDMGGSDLFAATMASYVVFGVLGALYLTLRLSDYPPTNVLKDLVRSVWHLKYHIVLFLFFGRFNISMYDSLIRPNDFRNMFLLASLVYAASISWIVFLRRRSLRLRLRLALAPAFIVLWLILGSDGTTTKAGQVLYAGENPEERSRGIRHGIMLAWHRFCDDLLGDVR